MDYLDRVNGIWAEEWACDDVSKRNEALRIIKELRDKVLNQGVREELINKFTEENLDKALMRFTEDTSTGIDMVTFKAIKALPPCAKRALF